MEFQKFRSRIALFILPFFISVCDDSNGEEIIEVNCGNLRTGLIYKDREKIGIEIDKMTDDLPPNPTKNDPIGHSENLTIITQSIHSCDVLEAEIFCYACVETNPPQSEIMIKMDSAGVKIERIIDISTPSDKILKFSGIHQ
ncbi:MAG: hypothetical protein U9N31_02815 [Candidatus Marinimicrobia bacterium]|nr:hypothetical protein [Candidatus Neomarinimicrobiota bacterium]